MIYITGDCHSEYNRFNTANFPEQYEMTKRDYVIICGDFGFWDNSKRQEHALKWLDEKPFTTLWIDGNHENYDLLKEYPVEEWHGGKVQFIKPSVIHLMRGQVFQIGGESFFAFGGARSHDIDGGILNRSDLDFARRKKQLDREWKCYRINHESWWEEEMASEAEMQEGLKNLSAHNWAVDNIITHCCPSYVQAVLSGGMYQPDAMTNYFQSIAEKVAYKNWFFGHYHDDRRLDDKYILLYEQIVPLCHTRQQDLDFIFMDK